MRQTGKFLDFLFSSAVASIKQLARKPAIFGWSLLFNKAAKWRIDGAGGSQLGSTLFQFQSNEPLYWHCKGLDYPVSSSSCPFLFTGNPGRRHQQN